MKSGSRHRVSSHRYVFFCFSLYSTNVYLGIDYSYGHQQHLHVFNHHQNGSSSSNGRGLRCDVLSPRYVFFWFFYILY
jgi:hypothetical protein